MTNIDNVNHPSHYAQHCSIECWEAEQLFLGQKGFLNFCLGNAFKYLWRSDFKENKMEDMAKADWYINKVKELKDVCGDWYSEDDEKLESLIAMWNRHYADELGRVI